jgi:hypothetical protein
MLKYFLAVVIAAFILASCNEFSKSSKAVSGNVYGEKFDTTNSITTSQLMQGLQTNNSADAVITGTITRSCQSEGCWVNLDAGHGKELYVATDDKFFVPKDMAGKNVYVKGKVVVETIDDKVDTTFHATGIAVK